MAEEEAEVLAKILIVDDSRMVRASLVKQIRNRFRIREETDGEAGWEALLVDPEIRLVLTDLSMPKLDGFGLLERIRESKVARIQELPVVIISGDEDDVARGRALKLGASDFVSKGAGCNEITVRLDSLLSLNAARSELALSRHALAEQGTVDPVSGLSTPAYLNRQGEQHLSQARRHQVPMSVMLVEIDHYEQLIEWHGGHVAELITRKLARILASKVRQEDTISQLSGARFVVLSPNTDMAGCCAFAVRLQKAIDKLVMVYRDERIRIAVTIGISGAESDGTQSVENLIGVAMERVRCGVAAGGSRIVSKEGEIDEALAERYAVQSLSLDHALLQLRIGAEDEVMSRLADVIAAAMPLFKLLEERLHFGIPLGELENYQRK